MDTSRWGDGMFGMPGGGHRMVVAYVVGGCMALGSRNSVGSVGIHDARGKRLMQCVDGLIVLPTVVRETIVPEDVVMHEGNSPTLDGVGDDDEGACVGAVGQGLEELVVVVAIDVADIPAEGAPFGGKVTQLQCVLGEVEALHLVTIHDGDQIAQTMMCGKESGLPDSSLVAFAIAEDGEDAVFVGSSVLAGGIGHAGGDGESVSEGACAEFDAGQLMGYMSRESAAILVMGTEFVDGEEARFGQGGIDSGAGMSLAHNESVALGPVGFCWAYAEYLGVEDGHDVRH